MINIIDYNMGNLYSIKGALEYLNCKYNVITTPKEISNSEKIILPGVGSFHTAMENISQSGVKETLQEMVLVKKIPILGICLGMQILNSFGTEGKKTEGLNFVEGIVDRFDLIDRGLKVPHVGFNSIQQTKAGNLFAGIPDNTDFYFIHSFKVECFKDTDIASTTNYGDKFVSAIEKNHIWGCQFHPEKSQKNGLKIFDNFIRQ